MGWNVEVEVERFREHGGQDFLSFDPDVRVQKSGLVGAPRKCPLHATFVQRVLKSVPSRGVFGKVWVVAPDSKAIIDVSLQKSREVGELLDDVFFLKNAQEEICNRGSRGGSCGNSV